MRFACWTSIRTAFASSPTASPRTSPAPSTSRYRNAKRNAPTCSPSPPSTATRTIHASCKPSPRCAERNAIPHELHIAGADADLTAADLRRMAEDLGVGDAVKLLGPVPHDRIGPLVPTGRRPGLRLSRRNLRPPAPRSHGPAAAPSSPPIHDLPARNHRRRGRACRPDRCTGHRLSHRTRRHATAPPRRPCGSRQAACS